MIDIKEYIKEIKKLIEEEGGDAASVGNTTSNVDGYNIPGAFAKDEDEHSNRMDIIARTLGYAPVKKQNKKNFVNIHPKKLKTESLYSKMASQLLLNEIKYKDFKNDQTYTNNQKINNGIKKINSALYELESIVNQHAKLKTETSITTDVYWKSSKRKLQKIAERLLKISKKIVELSA